MAQALMFFHVSECAEGYMPKENDVVSFTQGAGKDGRPAAKAINPTSSGSSNIDLDDEALE